MHVGQNQTTKLDQTTNHRITDIILFSLEDGRAAHLRKEISHLRGHRNEQDNGDEARQKWDCYLCYAPRWSRHCLAR